MCARICRHIQYLIFSVNCWLHWTCYSTLRSELQIRRIQFNFLRDHEWQKWHKSQLTNHGSCLRKSVCRPVLDSSVKTHFGCLVSHIEIHASWFNHSFITYCECSGTIEKSEKLLLIRQCVCTTECSLQDCSWGWRGEERSVGSKAVGLHFVINMEIQLYQVTVSSGPSLSSR